MNKIQLFRLLRRNISLSYRRSPIFEQNQWAKVLTALAGTFFTLYLIIYGAMMGLAAEGDAGTIIAFMILILPIDFILRFIFQTTPAMMVKPYILLPISRFTAIECFLLSSHLSGYNLLWLSMFITYSVIATIGGAAVGAVGYVLILSELLIILNSQTYLFFRTLINRNVLWGLAAILLYAIPYLTFLPDGSDRRFSRMLDSLQAAGTDWWALPLALCAIACLFLINRHFQFKYVYEEISRKQEARLRTISDFRFLNCFGIMGEYIKLEMKANLRCKVMRSRTILSLTLVTVFSLLIAYTDIYDSAMMTNFWCLYCFAIYSVTSLIKIMGQEGNYIDLLMTHRENILSLLKAKYWFYCTVLLIPFVIMLPAVAKGKFTLLMLAAYMLLTAGLLHFIIFQLAVYNRQTLPLHQRITGKANFENGLQIAIETAAMIVPGLVVTIGFFTVGQTATFIFMCILGTAFILTHHLWLRNIYNRMMHHRYTNLEGFHSSRE